MYCQLQFVVLFFLFFHSVGLIFVRQKQQQHSKLFSQVLFQNYLLVLFHSCVDTVFFSVGRFSFFVVYIGEFVTVCVAVCVCVQQISRRAHRNFEIKF